MKKLRIFLALAMLLTAILVLSSCGNADISDVFLKNASPDSKNAESVTLIEDLYGSYNSTNISGELIYRKSSAGTPNHKVVNINTGKTLYSKTSSSEISVVLQTVNINDTDVSFFVVKEYGTGSNTAVYNANGEKVLSFDGLKYCRVTFDLIHIENKCYRVEENGNISYAFDYPAFSEYPAGLQKYEDYYYSFTSDSVTVYDDELEFVSKYTVPSYADEHSLTLLENGNVLVQYIYLTDTLSEKYDFMMYTLKYNLVTQVFNVKSGNTKNVRCDYFFSELENAMLNAKEYEKDGIDPEKLSTYGYAHKIENRLLNEEPVLVKVSNKGKVTEFDKINGESITDFYMMDTKRYVVSTDNHDYILNNKGKILADVTNASIYGKYIVSEDTYEIYSSDAKFLYNFGDHTYSIYGMIGDNLILYSHIVGQDDKIFSGSSNLTVYRDSSNGGVVRVIGKGFYIHDTFDNTRVLEFRDTDGKLIKKLTNVSSASLIGETDDAAIVMVEDNLKSSYYIVKYK